MSDTPVCSKASVRLLHYLAATILKYYGNEGREVVREAVYKFGHSQGKKIRRKVEALGLEANLENFLRYNGIYEQGSFLVRQDGADGRVSYELCHCPLDDQIIADQEVELGLLLCEVDRALLLGYNRHLAFAHSSTIKLGSHSCHFVSRVHSA